MPPSIASLVEGARRLAMKGSVVIWPDMYEYKSDEMSVICRGHALTVYLTGFADPVLFVSSKGSVTYVEEKALGLLGERLCQ